MEQYDVIIIGAGPAGLTAAIYVQRAGLRALVLEEYVCGGQIANTPEDVYKRQAWTIPIKTRPFQTAAAAVNGDTGQLLEEGLAIPMAAIFRQDKQILQIDAGASKKR